MGKEKGYKNLVVPTSEQARENGKKGGIASAAATAKRKTMKEALQVLLQCKPTPEMLANCAETLSIEPKDLQEVILGAVATKAVSGDVKAAEFLRDTIGEKPKDRIEQDINTFTPIKIEFVE